MEETKTSGSFSTGQQQPSKRFTLHHIETEDYVIKGTVLASAERREQAQDLAEKFSFAWYYNVAIWDHLTDIIDFGGEKNPYSGYYPLQPVSAVRIDQRGYTIHRIVSFDRESGEYRISPAILKQTSSRERVTALARWIANKPGPYRTTGMAIWDHRKGIDGMMVFDPLVGIIDFAHPKKTLKVEPMLRPPRTVLYMTPSEEDEMNANFGNRYTIHSTNNPYEIRSSSIASTGKWEEAHAIASSFCPPWYYGVAILDKKTRILDFGGDADPKRGKFYPLKRLSAVNFRYPW
jgi:hypothetical protein